MFQVSDGVWRNRFVEVPIDADAIPGTPQFHICRLGMYIGTDECRTCEINKLSDHVLRKCEYVNISEIPTICFWSPILNRIA